MIHLLVMSLRQAIAGERMEPNHQLFGHFLRHHMEMLERKGIRHNEMRSEPKQESGMKGAIEKLLKSLVSYLADRERGK